MGQRQKLEVREKVKIIRDQIAGKYSIEEAAKRAGVGTKTWSRYEAGESIRADKEKGLCFALKWKILPERDPGFEDEFDIEEYKSHPAWSDVIADLYGESAAVSFIVGSDILTDYIKMEMEELSKLPAGSHLGQLDYSFLSTILPEQFLMRYDYDFLFALRITTEKLRLRASVGESIQAHSVMEELVYYLIVEAAELLMEDIMLQPYFDKLEDKNEWKEWIYDLFDDEDIITFLYADLFILEPDHAYHFNRWREGA